MSKNKDIIISNTTPAVILKKDKIEYNDNYCNECEHKNMNIELCDTDQDIKKPETNCNKFCNKLNNVYKCVKNKFLSNNVGNSPIKLKENKNIEVVVL